jgi:hypothetical protein
MLAITMEERKIALGGRTVLEETQEMKEHNPPVRAHDADH